MKEEQSQPIGICSHDPFNVSWQVGLITPAKRCYTIAKAFYTAAKCFVHWGTGIILFRKVRAEPVRPVRCWLVSPPPSSTSMELNHPRCPRCLPRNLGLPHVLESPCLSGLPILSIRGGRGCCKCYITCWLSIPRFFFVFEASFDPRDVFQHHVWVSEVLRLERPVSQPRHQLSR